MNKILNLCNK